MDLLCKFISSVIILFTLGNINYGKTLINSPFDCSDLKKILETDELKSHFYGTGRTQYDTLTFIDTLNVFNCKRLTVDNQEICFLNHYPRELNNGVANRAEAERNLRGRSNRMITLLTFKKVESNYEMVLWQVNDNAVIIMMISKRKGRLCIEVTSTGVF